jgi:enediyne biosynthesis protein E4
MRRRWTAILVALAGVVAIAATGWLFLGRATTPASALGAPRFSDETAAGGLAHTYGGDSRFFVGGGMATFDCDDDGMAELYLAGGARPAALFHNDSEVAGALRFSRLGGRATELTDVTGAYPIDIDADGELDLAVMRAGENVLLRGLGECRFERANERWEFDGGTGRSMAFSATWEDGATLPTLAVGDYIPLDELGTPMPPCPDNQLFRPTTDQAYAPPTALSPGFCPLSMLFSDWDRSGRRDLRITNDRQYYTDGQEQLWRLTGAGPSAYSGEDGWVTMQIWGMGIASQDLTDDGYPEIYLTSQGDNKLQTLLAGPDAPTYRDIALRRGANVPQPFAGGEELPSTAWHPEFADVNNDGFTDLFVSKGNVSEQAGYATRDPSELLLGQPDGTFLRAADEAGIVNFARGRGAALVDLNLDGLLDLVEVNLDAPVEVWRNLGAGTAEQAEPMGHWLAIRLRQAGGNRDAIGSWVEIRVGDAVIRREITIGGGHLSGQLGWLHVGLGPSSRADVRVRWPDGTETAWQRVDGDSFVIIDRDAAQPVAWRPAASD